MFMWQGKQGRASLFSHTLSFQSGSVFGAPLTQELGCFLLAILADAGSGVIPSVLQRRNDPVPSCGCLEE